MNRFFFQNKQSLFRLFSTNNAAASSPTAKKLMLSHQERKNLDINYEMSRAMFKTMNEPQLKLMNDYLTLKRIQVGKDMHFLSTKLNPLTMFSCGVGAAISNGIVLPMLFNAQQVEFTVFWFFGSNFVTFGALIFGGIDCWQKNKLYQLQFDDDIAIVNKLLSKSESDKK